MHEMTDKLRRILTDVWIEKGDEARFTLDAEFDTVLGHTANPQKGV
jgi:hypothetical protein